MSTNPWGIFPFGRLNSERPARKADHSAATVIGVYPSAWHVTWSAPANLRDDRRKGRVAALAVDVEPTVFWDGNSDDFGARVKKWKGEVGFIDGKHGQIAPTSPSTNGSSGDKVARYYLEPLGLDPGHVTFTDVYPVFLTKTSPQRREPVDPPGGKEKAVRREQGDAIRDEYDSIAEQLGMPPSSLPHRISDRELPLLAATTFGERLVADLTEAASPLIITLGEEVWNTLLAVPSLHARAPRKTFADLYGTSYGESGELTVGGRTVPWLPLVHPGLLKGKIKTASDDDGHDSAADFAGPRTVKGWETLHAGWAEVVRRQSAK